MNKTALLEFPRVTLVFDQDGKVTTSIIGHFNTIKKAMAVAKKIAGRNAKFVRKGLSIMYVGPNGAAYIT